MRIYVLCFAAGIWCLQVQPNLPPPHWYWLVAPFALMVTLAAKPNSRVLEMTRRLLAIAGWGGCGFLWAAWLAGQRLSDTLPAQWEGVDIQVVGVVASMPQPNDRGLRFEFDVERAVTPQAIVPAHLALSWWGSPARDDKSEILPELHAGERWQFTVRLRRPHGTLNPHGFDYEAWLLERNIRATGYIRPGGNQRIAASVLRPQYLVERVRGAVRNRIQTVLADAPYAGVLTALAIGDQRAITPDQWQIFTRTGVNHLVSISGLHVTMIAGLAFALVFNLWCRSARLTLRLPARKAAAVAGLVVAFLYAWLAGFAVPAQRTVYMLAVVAVALWTGRLTSASVVLCLALFAVLVIDPWAVLAPGFWLSFGAVALILLVSTGRIAQTHWLNAWARVQWAVTLGLIPLLLALFQQVSLVSPIANAIAIPVMSLAVVPLTLVGIVLPFDLVLHLAQLVMTWCGSLLEWMSMLPAAVWQQHAPRMWTVAVAMPAIAWLLMPRGFPARWIGAVALLPLLLVTPQLPAKGALRVAVLDVGQGLAVVAQTRNHALLYDAGPAFGPQIDSGNRIIVPYLRATGVPVLNGMVVTHGDADHTGGVNSVLQAMPVGWVLSSLPDDHPLLADVDSPHRCEAGQSWQWDDVKFELLHPAADNYVREKFRVNDRGCVLRISTAGASVLLTADIEQKSERELLAAVPEKLRAQVLLVPHHGSRTSSSPDFLAQVRPDVAIVAAGYRNRFGHPKDDVLDRIRALGSRIYRTDYDGAVLLEVARDGAIDVRRYRELFRRYWHSPSENSDSPFDE